MKKGIVVLVAFIICVCILIISYNNDKNKDNDTNTIGNNNNIEYVLKNCPMITKQNIGIIQTFYEENIKTNGYIMSYYPQKDNICFIDFCLFLNKIYKTNNNTIEYIMENVPVNYITDAFLMYIYEKNNGTIPIRI